jgi:hypothetical protein
MMTPSRRRAMAFLVSAAAVLVAHTVLLKPGRVLRAAYERSPAIIRRSMTQLLGLPDVPVEKSEEVVKGLPWS